MDKIYHCILNYSDILIFVIFQIEIYSIIVSHKFRVYALFLFFVTSFDAVKELYKFCF